MDLEEKLTPIAQKFCDESASKWQYGRYIAEGNSAAVFRIDGATGPAALKIYDPVFFQGEDGKTSIHRVEAHKDLIGHSCPYLIQIVEAGAFDDTAFVLMEFLPWKELADKIAEIQPGEIWPIVEQLTESAYFLEKQGISHRDIKPENIVISDDHTQLKLLDLGILKSTLDEDGAGSDDDGKKPFIGTVQYGAPEYLLRKEAPGEDGLRALTFYQIGGVLHDLIMKKRLFGEYKAKNNKLLLADVIRTEIPFIDADDVDPNLISLARDCLVKDPERRMELVHWERFQKSRSADTAMEAAKIRYGLKVQGSHGATSENSDMEGHRLALINVARALAERLTLIRSENSLPALTKSRSKEEIECICQEVIIKHTTGVSHPVDVMITFEITAPVGDAQCLVNLDATRHDRGKLAVGSVMIADPARGFEILHDRISYLLISEYISQIEENHNKAAPKQ